MDAELVTRVSHLFMDAGRDLAARFAEANIPETFTTTESVVEAADRESWQVRGTEIEASVLRDPGQLYKVTPWLSEALVTLLLECSETIASHPEANLPAFTGFRGFSPYIHSITDVEGGNQPVAFDDDPAGWTLRSMVIPALSSYLSGLPTVSSVDNESARAAAQEMLDFCTAAKIKVRTTAYVAGIELPEGMSEISAGSYTVRTLTTADQSRLFNSNHPWGSPHFSTLPATALEVVTDHPRRDPLISTGAQALQPIVWALHLMGFRLSGLTVETSTTPVWATNGRWASPINSIPQTTQNWRELTEESLRAAVNIANKLQGQSISEPNSVKTMALHRFFSGMARENSADALVDFTVALESLLLPYDEVTRYSELSYRFRTHGAHYLSPTKEDRISTARNLREVYETRSRLVHGGNYPDQPAIEKARGYAYELSRKGLLRAVNDGFPTVEQFNRMVLGLAEPEIRH